MQRRLKKKAMKKAHRPKPVSLESSLATYFAAKASTEEIRAKAKLKKADAFKQLLRNKA